LPFLLASELFPSLPILSHPFHLGYFHCASFQIHFLANSDGFCSCAFHSLSLPGSALFFPIFALPFRFGSQPSISPRFFSVSFQSPASHSFSVSSQFDSMQFQFMSAQLGLSPLHLFSLLRSSTLIRVGSYHLPSFHIHVTSASIAALLFRFMLAKVEYLRYPNCRDLQCLFRNILCRYAFPSQRLFCIRASLWLY